MAGPGLTCGETHDDQTLSPLKFIFRAMPTKLQTGAMEGAETCNREHLGDKWMAILMLSVRTPTLTSHTSIAGGKPQWKTSLPHPGSITSHPNVQLGLLVANALEE